MGHNWTRQKVCIDAEVGNNEFSKVSGVSCRFIGRRPLWSMNYHMRPWTTDPEEDTFDRLTDDLDSWDGS